MYIEGIINLVRQAPEYILKMIYLVRSVSQFLACINQYGLKIFSGLSIRIVSILVSALLLCACSSSPDPGSKESRKANMKGEYIYRVHDEHFFAVDPPTRMMPQPYPWEQGTVGHNPKITKEFFRCKGSSLNPVHVDQQNGETVRYYDCGGAEKHSLPLRDNKEFIYPILIELVNYLQEKQKKGL